MADTIHPSDEAPAKTHPEDTDHRAPAGAPPQGATCGRTITVPIDRLAVPIRYVRWKLTVPGGAGDDRAPGIALGQARAEGAR